MNLMRCAVRLGGLCVAVGALFPLATDAREASDSRWAVSAGVEARQIRTDFSQGAPTVPFDSFRTSYSEGLGNVGLYDGRNAVTYEDGAIPVQSPSSFWFPLRPGVAWYRVDDTRAQVTRGGSPVRWFGSALDEIRFHSRGEQFESDASATGDDDVVNALSPYVALHRRGCRRGKTDFGCVLRYAFSTSEQESGAEQAAWVRRTSTDYTYRYDGAASGSQQIPPVPARNGVVVHDPSALQNSQRSNGLFLDRARSPEISESRQVSTFTALSSAETEIALHELLLGVEARRPLGSRASCTVTVGPTVSMLDWDLRASTVWQDDQGTAVVRESARESDMEVLVGCRAALGFQLALTRTGRWALDVQGGYAWAAPVDCEAGNASAEVDISSVTCSVGLRGRL
jgi:hypothetical protein